jgi:hypothetical protein
MAKPKYKALNLTIETEVYESLKLIADELGISISKLATSMFAEVVLHVNSINALAQTDPDLFEAKRSELVNSFEVEYHQRMLDLYKLKSTALELASTEKPVAVSKP